MDSTNCDRGKIKAAYFPCSAVMYSSQEIVLGAGAVRDCRLTGCGQEVSVSTVRYLQIKSEHLLLSYLEILFTDASSFTQALHDGFVPQDVLLAEVLSPLP